MTKPKNFFNFFNYLTVGGSYLPLFNELIRSQANRSLKIESSEKNSKKPPNFILTESQWKRLLDQIIETIKLFKYRNNERKPN